MKYSNIEGKYMLIYLWTPHGQTKKKPSMNGIQKKTKI